MDDETIRTLITCGTSMGVMLISNLFTFLTAKTNNKKDNSNLISKEQYIKLFAPLHKILFFQSINNKNREFSKVIRIISDNYQIVPKVIRDEFNNCKKNNCITDKFKEQVEVVFRYLSSILGYSREKLDNDEKKEAKKIINYKKQHDYMNINYIVSYITVLVAFIAGILSLFMSTLKFSSISGNRIDYKISLIVTLCIVLIEIIICFLNKKIDK